MKKDRVIELLEEQNRHFKEQIKAADKREQQSQRLICELTSQVQQLTDAVQSLEEALTLKNGKLKKQENISRSLSKLVSNESEKQISDKSQPVSETAPSVRLLPQKNGGITTPNVKSILNWKKR